MELSHSIWVQFCDMQEAEFLKKKCIQYVSCRRVTDIHGLYKALYFDKSYVTLLSH